MAALPRLDSRCHGASGNPAVVGHQAVAPTPRDGRYYDESHRQ